MDIYKDRFYAGDVLFSFKCKRCIKVFIVKERQSSDKKDFGVDKWQISIELQKLCNDALCWIAHHTYTADEIAIRFKHRLVSIHCFSNGNGRHSRLIADVIVHKVLGMELFGWGMSGMRDGRDLRKTYLDAIRAADAANFGPLLAFARS
jgi:Fic-DOC domain mobile mystery protein B